MKKILAFLLAAVMVAGLATTTFADWTDPNATLSASTSTPTTVKSRILELTLRPTDAVGSTTKVGLNAVMNFVTTPDGPDYTTTTTAYDYATGDPVVEDVTVTVRDQVIRATINLLPTVKNGTKLDGEVEIAATALVHAATANGNNGAKPLTWTIDLSGTTLDTGDTFVDGEIADTITDFAPDTSLIDHFDVRANSAPSAADYENYDSTGDWTVLNVGTLAPVDKPEIRFYLWGDMFKETYETNPDQYIGRTGVDSAKMEVRVQTSKGSNALDGAPKISYDGGKAYVDVQLIEKWHSVDDLKYDFYIYLVIDGKRMNKGGKGVRVYGTLNNDHIDVDDDDSFDGSYQEVAVAKTFNEDIRFDLGLGISIYTKFFKGKEYYGIAERAKDEAADVVMAAHPDIDNIVRLYTMGLNSTGDVVSFDTDWDGYYVYDEGYNLLGMSDERVPYRSTYYLANRPLDVDVDVEPVDPPVDTEVVPPAGTGGDMAPSNANANPGTGF